MMSSIDIENSKTRQVITYELPLLEYNPFGVTIFDITKLSKNDIEVLKDAINNNEEYDYTDIEMFFSSTEPGTPNFGSDFDFKIVENTLVGTYIKKIKKGVKK